MLTPRHKRTYKEVTASWPRSPPPHRAIGVNLMRRFKSPSARPDKSEMYALLDFAMSGGPI